MKIIDAHNHPDWHGHDLKRFLENMDANNIEKTWILSWECGAHEYQPESKYAFPAGPLGTNSNPIPFERCLYYKEQAPARFILGYCPDPRLPDACLRLRAAHYIYGAQVCGELKCRMMYDDFDALRLFRTAGELRMPVTFHLQYDFQPTCDDQWGEWWGGTIDTIERVLQACPETNFLGHAPGFWIHMSNDDLYTKTNYAPVPAKVVENGRIDQLLRKYPNLYCDMSAGSGCTAFTRDMEHARKFLIEFQDRVVYARDYFDNVHQEFLAKLDLPETILEKSYHGNAEKLVHEPLRRKI